ncbi:uncharacterized protein LOC128545868 [Mercenaria mercenaria]|uniref:uncharacterized protein LOC128545868 n=1 Tax=Mercenaria mercenaria TaxID=6596 RepID=UPI00234E863E|nr:uncharacterized protein LOC128545868 [Mercenaria mercenaria]
MAGLPETPEKRARLETEFDRFHVCSDKQLFRNAYKNMLYNRKFALVSDTITYCDSNAENGILFSKSSCHASRVVNKLYAFESLFKEGEKILNEVTDTDGYIPQDEQTKTLLLPLLTFLLDKESQETLRSLCAKVENETELMITLGTHLFSKLAVSKDFTMDKYAANKACLCICGKCERKQVYTFDDTSVGHRKVWHGNVDIILESCDIGVHCTPVEERSPGAEVKFCDMNSFMVRDQILAQTITFSFLQQQRHPAMKHFLIPSILASCKGVQFFFYDSRNDILLESRPFEFFYPDSEEKLLNYQAVIAIWLVLNYKYLCSGPTKSILDAPKANFPRFAGDALEIYKSQLRFRNVSETGEEEELPDVLWSKITNGLYDDVPLEKD